MQILLTNIGNRNIRYKKQLYFEQIESKSSFRDWTKNIWDNFDSENENIELNILDTVLKQDGFHPDKVFIIVSNQVNNPQFNKQDTLYEGEIIQRLIRRDYQIEEVELREFTDDVTNENDLLKFYQQFYIEIISQYGEADFVFCDAGGTGQQKTAAKIMAEFMFPDGKWKILYPREDGSIEEKSQIEYRNIINKEQAIALVRKNKYEAALNILSGNVDKITDNSCFNIIAFTYFRIKKDLKRTKRIWETGNSIQNRNDGLIMSALFPYKRAYSEILYDLFEKKYLFLSESLLIAYHNLLTENYQESILEFAVFYEEFIRQSRSKIEGEIRIIIGESKNKNKNKNTITRWIEYDKRNFLATRQYAERKCMEKAYDYTSIPLAIHIIDEQDFFPELQPLAKKLLPYLDFTYSPYKEGKQNAVRDVRNKVAHEGKYIDKNVLAKELPYYGQLLKECLYEWGLPQEDIYEQLNAIIEKQIRNN
ncbi:MAG: hypothetical protein LBJ60_06770 [Tannerellaceae bacterium]|jgi:hypothetical protein|nr:hypothetical protein [Tannerellaceae bacterium]